MSHYKPYPAYKDSGVEWIGKVPEHWDVTPFKWHIERNDGGVWGNDPSGENDTVVLRSTEQTVEGQWIIDQPALRQISLSEKQSALLEEGDLVVTKSSGSSLHIGKTTFVTSEVARLECCYSNFMQRLRMKQSFLPRLAWYVMNNGIAREQLDLSSNSTTGLANINGGMIGQLLLAIPPPTEQESLVRGLDRETTRIDALIAKKAEFIKLLAKKRQALITHAVTKGLNPKANMKDSGSKWLGEIPEHWEFVPSNSLFPESKERARLEDEHLSATQKYGVIPLAEYERLEERQVTHAVKNLDQRKHAEVDDFVISMRSFEGGIERVKACGCVRSSYVVLKAGDKAHAGFFTYLFKSSAYIQGLQATATFIRDGQDLSYSNFRQVKLPRPDLDEQKAIADFLDKSVSRINLLAEKTQLSIDLLKKRRSALITAAVTGQIDLRESA